MARKKEDRPYLDKGIIPVNFHKYGYPAYVIESLVDVKGNTEQEVLEQIVHEWTSANREFLKDIGITVDAARAAGYLRAKPPRPFVLVDGGLKK